MEPPLELTTRSVILAGRAFLVYNKEEINQLCQWATMKIKVTYFHKMGKPMGTKWAVSMEKQRFIQNVQEVSNDEFTRGMPEKPSFQGS